MGRPVVLVMGVSGCGKSTVGQTLSTRAGWPFLDADTLHSPAAIAKMRDGIPLTDADRWPWLDRVAGWIKQRHDTGEAGVVACSALKRTYRDRLREADAGLRIAYLRVDPDTLRERLRHRTGHFFPEALLNAQLTDLEPPATDEHPITVPSGLSPDRQADLIVSEVSG